MADRGWLLLIVLGSVLGCASEGGGGTAAPAPPPVAGALQPASAGEPAPAGAAAAGAGAGLGGASGTAGALGAAASMAVAGSSGEPASAAGGAGGASGASASDAGAAGAPAAGSGESGMAMFVLTPVGFPMAGDELTFPESANPPTNQSPEFTWTGVPAEAKSLALVFRDLGNDAVKWILWDIPPSATRVPPNISNVANPPEVPGSAQLGSLNNQGYAGPGSGARQYDFVLWALDVAKLPDTSGRTTAEIRMEILPMHEIATTEPILVRNTRNLP